MVYALDCRIFAFAPVAGFEPTCIFQPQVNSLLGRQFPITGSFFIYGVLTFPKLVLPAFVNVPVCLELVLPALLTSFSLQHWFVVVKFMGWMLFVDLCETYRNMFHLTSSSGYQPSDLVSASFVSLWLTVRTVQW